jgi:ferrous iron transport protein B
MVKVQANSYKWSLFSVLFPTTIGLVTASAIFTIGRTLDINGITMRGIVTNHGVK